MIEKIEQIIEKNRDNIARFIRFCIIGTLAAGIHYGIYYLLLLFNAPVNLAYAAGYIISFVANFFATNYFTFRTIPSWGKFIGFAGSHVVNFLLHMGLLNLFLCLGMHRLIAPVAVMAIAMIVQYGILNLVFRNKQNDNGKEEQ